MEKGLILTVLALEELAEMGYLEAWLGSTPNPHWPRHGNSGFVIASPKRIKNGWPAVWSLDDKFFGKNNCGNGLKEADQCQRGVCFLPGHYRFQKGVWERIEDVQGQI